ncbi:MAG: hypothetical protein ABEI27_01245 [Halobellus sp.]|uniref:hypothetical protein n=1 Tax=Halobellus sp. TaxID=1979212 RepID=UPI0035D47B39
MSAQVGESTVALVLQVVELNCDGEHLVAFSEAQIAQTLQGSGLERSEIERALSELTARGELVHTEDGYRCAE